MHEHFVPPQEVASLSSFLQSYPIHELPHVTLHSFQNYMTPYPPYHSHVEIILALSERILSPLFSS